VQVFQLQLRIFQIELEFSLNRIGRREDEDNGFGQEIEESILDMVMFFFKS